MTKKTAISLPDDLYRDIERARKRSRKDRSTWIQEAASEYLRKANQDEVEAWYAGYARAPLTSDERSFIEYGKKNLGNITDGLERPALSAGRRKRKPR